MAGCCSQGCAQLLSVLVAQLGLLLSLYAVHVEQMSRADAKYSPLCNINRQISCTRVFSSKYGSGFGIVASLLGAEHPLNLPNGLYGAAFFTISTLLSVSSARSLWLRVQLLLSVGALAGSCYLAYILVYILHDVCVVCVTSYVLTALLLLLSACRLLHAPRDKMATPTTTAGHKKRSKRD